MWLRKLSPFTVASKIYESSTEADLICPRSTVIPGDSWYNRFVGVRNQWVKALAARDLIMDIISLLGSPRSALFSRKSLANRQNNQVFLSFRAFATIAIGRHRER